MTGSNPDDPHQPYVPYSYGGSPQGPTQPEQLRGQQGRDRYVAPRSPLRVIGRIITIGPLLFILLTILFHSCSSTRQEPAASELCTPAALSISESPTHHC